jgi:hypothetical protein
MSQIFPGFISLERAIDAGETLRPILAVIGLPSEIQAKSLVPKLACPTCRQRRLVFQEYRIKYEIAGSAILSTKCATCNKLYALQFVSDRRHFASFNALLGFLQKYPLAFAASVLPELPSHEQAEQLASIIGCQDCKSITCGLIAYEVNAPDSCLAVRCKKCGRHEFVIVTTKYVTSRPDRTVIILGTTHDLKEKIEVITGTNCECGSRFVCAPVPTPAANRLRKLLPMAIECPQCGFRSILPFLDQPRGYFNYCLKMSGDIKLQSPLASLVFLAAALENFLQKAFIFKSQTNLERVIRRDRDASFQDLKSAKDCYLAEFNIRLPALLPLTDWERLLELMNLRNLILHNAGHDESFKMIVIDASDIEQFTDVVKRFVDALDRKLELLCIY